MPFRPTKNVGEAMRSVGALSTVGLAFVLALVIGFWFGTTLDTWLGTRPLFTFVFFFLGLAAGIMNVYRTVSQSLPGGSRTGSGAGQPGTGPAKPPSGPDDRDLHTDDP